jgi:site-specific DNA recombinase
MPSSHSRRRRDQGGTGKRCGSRLSRQAGNIADCRTTARVSWNPRTQEAHPSRATKATDVIGPRVKAPRPHNPARRTPRTARRYLLSGMCRCALCGTKMFSVPRFETRRYLCRSGNDFGGCGRMAVAAAPLEILIAEAVLYRLDTPELQPHLPARRPTRRRQMPCAPVSTAISQLEELTQLYARRAITAAEWIQARKAIEGRLSQNRRTMSRTEGFHAVDGYIGNGDELRSQWGSLNLDRQRAILQALVDHILIRPARRNGNRLDPDRIAPIWRL